MSTRVEILFGWTARTGPRPFSGLVHTRAELLNQDGECPMSIQVVNILRRRTPAA